MFKILVDSFTYFLLTTFNKTVRKQRNNPNEIPFIIINFNQLENLKSLINFLLSRGSKKIVVIDNKSDYPPLLDYYASMSDQITVERMQENLGHMVFFDRIDLQKKYGKGYYFLTDADILPNPQLPSNFAGIMVKKMDRYIHKIQKVGFALDLASIPEFYPLKTKVLDWEKKFWEKELEKDVYYADIDTTFALYKPQYPIKFKVKRSKFYKAIRLAGDFTCKHMGWYIDPKNLTDEQRHYMKTSSSSNSWKFDSEGNLDSASDY